MHEISIAENILNIVENVAKEKNLKLIDKIVLEIGKFSGVVPSLLQFALEQVKKDTIIEKTEIEIHTPPLILCCRHCDMEYFGDIEDLRCPVCSKENFDILQGKKMLVKTIIGE